MRSRLAIYLALLAATIAAGCSSAVWNMAQTRSSLESDLYDSLQLIATERYAAATVQLAPLAAAAQAQGRPDIASKALFWQGYCAEKTARIAEALRFYGDVVTTYPGTPAARQADERAESLRAAATTTTKD
jgi:hypothetical protein